MLNAGTLSLRGDSSTAFGNDVTVTGSATINSDRLTGTSPPVIHSLGVLTIGATTLNFTGGQGDVGFASTTLTGAATFNPTTADANLGAVTGAFGFTKTGTGTLLLGLGSIYSGPTTVSAGTLAPSANNASSPFSALTIAAGATFDLNGFSTAIGSLAGAGAVALGSGTLTTGFDDTSTTFSGSVSGTGGLTKSGAGTLTLTGSNSYTGATTINGGALQLGTANAIADTSRIVMPLTGDQIFDLNNFSETVGSIEGGGTIILGTGTLTTGGNNLSTVFAGTITGAGGLVKNGSGVLSLQDDSDYAGTTTINAGSLLIGHSAALGSTTGGTTVAAGAQLQIAGNLTVGSEPLTLNGSGFGGAGALRNLSDVNSWAGPVTLASSNTIGADSGSLAISGNLNAGANALTLTGAGDIRLSGVISGSGEMLKTGAGMLSLTNANTYTGATAISAGVVHIENGAALGTAAGGTTVASGASLQIESATGLTVTGEALTLNGTGAMGSGALDSVSGNNAWTGTVTLASNSEIQVLIDSLTISGAIGETGGAWSLIKTGDGALILSGSSTYTGATDIEEGTVQLTAAERISNISAVIIGSGALLDLNGFSETVGSLAGGGDLQFGNLAGTTLNAGGDSTSTEFSGGISGTGSLVKSGTGTLTLTGTSTYVGTTNINGGTLAISSNEALGAGGTLIFNGGNLQILGPAILDRNLVLNAPATIDSDDADVVVSGSISGTPTLTKAGSGTLVIAGIGSTPILIAEGTVSVTGSNSGLINIATGAALEGNGTTGAVTAQDASTISPGPFTATLTTGNLSLLPISDLHIEIAGPGLGEYDSLNVVGTVNIGGNLTGALIGDFVPTLGNFERGGPNLGLQKFFIIVNDGTDAVTGAFANQVTTGNQFGGTIPTITFDGQEFAISYTGDSATNSFTGGNDVVLVAVPEPGSLAAILCASALCIGLRPRRALRREACR